MRNSPCGAVTVCVRIGHGARPSSTSNACRKFGVTSRLEEYPRIIYAPRRFSLGFRHRRAPHRRAASAAAFAHRKKVRRPLDPGRPPRRASNPRSAPLPDVAIGNARKRCSRIDLQIRRKLFAAPTPGCRRRRSPSVGALLHAVVALTNSAASQSSSAGCEGLPPRPPNRSGFLEALRRNAIATSGSPPLAQRADFPEPSANRRTLQSGPRESRSSRR